MEILDATWMLKFSLGRLFGFILDLSGLMFWALMVYFALWRRQQDE